MRVAVHVTSRFVLDVSINLGGGQRNVTEQLLDGAQIGAAFEQMRGERVPQRVRRERRRRRRASQVALAACGGLPSGAELRAAAG